MPSDIRSSNKHIEPVKDMGYGLELKRSSRQQQTSKAVQETILSPRTNRSLKFQDKRKVESPFGQPYLDRHHELRQSAGDGLMFQLKSPGNHQKQWIGSKANKDDELVKHMSNLPGYLQRVEKGKNLQEKALNFGVLAWEHLEKWKHNQKRIPPRGNANSSSSSNNSSFMASGSSSLPSTAQGKTLAPRRKQPPLHCSDLNSSHEKRLSQGVKLSQGKVIQLQDFETAPKSTLDGQRNLRWTDMSSGRNYSEIKLARGKRKDSDQKITSRKEASLSNLRKHGVSLTSKDIMSAQDGETEQRVEELQASEFNLAHEHCPGEHQSIVLLVPKHSPKKSCSEVFQLSEPKILFDQKLAETNRKSFSDDSAELCSQIPHSCPLPVKGETNTESDMKPHSLISARSMELPPDASHTCPCSNESPPILPRSMCVTENKAGVRPLSSNVFEISKQLDQETAELAAAKGRHPSPNRRFSFSLSRMSRSFSFKEGPAVPQLSSSYASAKSGPVTSEASDCLDNSNRYKANAHRRARSSPLRRLLDPLLKPKVADPHHSVETVQPLKGNLKSSTSKLINSSGSLQDKKHEASTVEALLRLTIKNGLPLFKLVVDNSSDILAATMKKLTTSGKDDPSWICTFYSVHEIRKKSGGWINQGHKGKSCGFGYNIVGQMKVSSSHIPDLTAQSCKDQFAVRECVLYSVDLRQEVQVTPEFVPNRELAAIVVKIPSEKNNDGERKGEDLTGKGFTKCLQEDRNSCNTEETENSHSTIVILPGGIHGLPSKGVPSPLIKRWKSGGSCDCGGWDVGCTLRILANQDQSCKNLGPFMPCSTPDRLDLFVQGGAQENRPIFSLAPFKKGIYSVQFNASISLLQAFSICIAFISSQKSSDVSEVNNLSEAKLFQESAFTGCDRIKTPTVVNGEAPGKYILSPPLSPVGRV